MKWRKKTLKLFKGMFGSTVNITIAYAHKENASDAHGILPENVKERR